MDDPIFTSNNVVGGSSANYTFSAMSREIHSNQSFILIQTFTEADGGLPFDISAATSTLFVSAYKNTLDPFPLTSGVLSDSGGGTIDTVTFTVPKDLIPTTLGTFPQRYGGNSVFFYILEDADSVLEFGQGVNVIDPSYSLTGEVDPSSSTITTQRNDLGTVEDTIIVDPPVQSFELAYIVGSAGATGDWVGQENNLAISNGSSWIFTLPEEGNFVFDKNLGSQKTFNGSSWEVSAAGDMLKADYDQAGISEQLVGLTASQDLTNKSVNAVTLSNSGIATSYLDETGVYSTPAGASLPIDDTTSIVQDPVDSTRQMRIDVGAVGSSQTRALFMPNQDIDLTPDSGDFLANISADTAPQLGGTLGTNGNDIDFGDSSDILNLRNVDLTNYSELTISGGIITANQALHNIDTQADAATDDLDTINIGTGNIIFVTQNNALRVITLKNGTGNLDIGADIPMVFGTIYQLIYNQTSWQLVGSAAAGGGSSLPVTDTTAIVKGAVTDTKLMRIDVEAKVAAATTRVLQMPNTDVNLFPQGRISPSVTAVTDINWDDGCVFNLGVLTEDVTLTFSNIKQSQTIVIEYTSDSGFDVIALPVSVTVLNGGTSTQDSNNIIYITSTDESTEQQASFSTDTAAGDLEGVKLISTTTYTLTDADSGFLIYFTNVAGCTVSLNNGLATGFFVSLIQDTATTVLTLAGTAALKAGSDLITAVDNDIMVILPRPTPDEYYVTV